MSKKRRSWLEHTVDGKVTSKELLPEFRSIKVHAEVYAALRARQADIVRDGWEAWGMQFMEPPTLGQVINAALMSMRVRHD